MPHAELGSRNLGFPRKKASFRLSPDSWNADNFPRIFFNFIVKRTIKLSGKNLTVFREPGDYKINNSIFYKESLNSGTIGNPSIDAHVLRIYTHVTGK